MRLVRLVLFALMAPGSLLAQDTASSHAAAETAIRQTFRQYDAVLRTGNPKAVAPFWADE